MYIYTPYICYTIVPWKYTINKNFALFQNFHFPPEPFTLIYLMIKCFYDLCRYFLSNL